MEYDGVVLARVQRIYEGLLTRLQNYRLTLGRNMVAAKFITRFLQEKYTKVDSLEDSFK